MFFRKLFLSYLIICIFPLLLIAFIIGNFTLKTVNSYVTEAAVNTLNQCNKNISSILSETKDEAFYISMNKEIQKSLSNEKEFSNLFEVNREITLLKNIILYSQIFNEDYSSIELYSLNKKGYPLEQQQNAVMSHKAIETKEWYKETLNRNGKLYWHISNDFGKKQISLSKVIKNVKDIEQNIAIVSVDIDISKFNSIISSVFSTNTSKIYLVDNSGKVICSNDMNISEENIKNLNLDKNSSSKTSFIKNKNTIVFYNTLPETNWKIIAMVPMQELLGEYYILKNLIYIVTLISLLLAIFLSLYFSYNISKPIRNLSNSMRRVENGDLDIKVKNTYTDEIGTLYSSFNYMIEKINTLISEVYISKIKKKDAELKALQAQINPHFLYNTLNSITWLAMKYNAEDIIKIVTSLAALLRYSINKGDDITDIQCELEHVKSYIEIQKIRYSNKFSVEFNIDESIFEYKTIKLILQPLVENSIIHGLETYQGEGIIKINGYKINNDIILEVINNGALVDLEKVNNILNSNIKTKSQGIENVNNRLNLYYGNDYGLSYSIKNGLTIARLSIPTI